MTVDWHGFRADARNLPQPRAGAYLITHVESGKRYVGISNDVERRLRRHGRATDPSYLHRAIQRHGRAAFTIEPLYYSIVAETDELPIVEAILIQDYDSIASGYNVMAMDGAVGPYGPTYAESIKQLWQNEDYRVKRAAAFARPDVRARRSTAIKESMKRPEVIAKCQTEVVRKRRVETRARTLAADPTIMQRHGAHLRELLRTDRDLYEGRVVNLARCRTKAIAAVTKAVTGSTWVTNGVESRRLPNGAEIPEGWRTGRADGQRYARYVASSGFWWITDGATNRKVDAGSAIPENWRRGKIHRKYDRRAAA